VVIQRASARIEKVGASKQLPSVRVKEVGKGFEHLDASYGTKEE
jgi:hypothetical protein